MFSLALANIKNSSMAILDLLLVVEASNGTPVACLSQLYRSLVSLAFGTDKCSEVNSNSVSRLHVQVYGDGIGR